MGYVTTAEGRFQLGVNPLVLSRSDKVESWEDGASEAPAAANWYDGAIFASGWEGGSDALNTGGAGTATGDGVWTSLSNGDLTRSTSSPLAGSADCQYSGTTSAHVYYTFTAASELTARCRFKLVTDGMATNEYVSFFGLGVTGPDYRMKAMVIDVSGTIYLRVHCYKDGTGFVQVGSSYAITVGTEYQLEIYFKRADIAGWKLYAEGGGAALATGENGTDADIADTDIIRLAVGPMTYRTNAATTTIKIDNAAVWAGSYVGPEP